jgi:hypothetical protein
MEGSMIHLDPIGDLRDWNTSQREIDRHVELMRLAREGRSDHRSLAFVSLVSARGLVRAIHQLGGRFALSPRTLPLG